MNATMTSRFGAGGPWRAPFVVVLAAIGLIAAAPARAQPPTDVGRAVRMDVSPPLRSIPPAKASPGRLGLLPDLPGESSDGPEELPDAFRSQPVGAEALAPYSATPDPVRQTTVGSALAGPSPLVNWSGVSNSENTFFVSPKAPDAEGDVGLNDYVQWANLKFKIWSKSGTLRYGPASGNTLWAGLGGPCQEYNWGDPQVTFDRIANRWVFMQYAFPTNFTEPIPPYYLCFAVSTTADPTGAYYRYAYRLPDYFPDYGKLGVWPDGYYVTTNNIDVGHVAKGAAVYAFDRSKMLAGDPSASFIEYQQSPAYRYLLPANFTGSTLPSPGAPEYFGAIEPVSCKGSSCTPTSEFGFTLRLWRFHADFAVPSSSSFVGPQNLVVSNYHSLCMMAGCIPQPGTEQKVDAGSDHLMQRLDYRNLGDHESLVTTQTVDAGNGVAGMRWYDIHVDSKNGTAEVARENTYAPADGVNRWMGSVAMDGAGNIALGYSMSNAGKYPSVGYTGSAAGTTTMGLGETTLVHGGGSETGTDRWGDYSAMSIDPSDEETFWYTQEYYAATSGLGWTTRIGSFRLAQGPSATLTQVNGVLAVFPYVTAQHVTSIGGGCTPGQGSLSWSVSGPASESGTGVPCSSAGTWTASMTQLSSDGEYTLSASQGGTSGGTQTLNIDGTRPVEPTLSGLLPYIKNGQSLTATEVEDNAEGSGVKQVNYLYCSGASCTPNTLIGSSSTLAGGYAVTWDAQPPDGSYRVMAQTEDKAGNTADSAIESTIIDNTRPSVAISEVNGSAATFPYATTQNVTAIAGPCGVAPGDAAAVTWTVTLSGATTASGSSPCSEGGWSATVSLSTEGNYTLSATQKDEAGNVGSSGSRSLSIDRTAPSAPTLGPLPTYIRNGQLLTATGVTDSGSGIKQISYLFCAGASCTPDTPIGSSSTAAGNYPVTWSGQPADGAYRVLARAEDKAGNAAQSAAQATTIDNTAPTVSLTEVNGSVVTFPRVTNQTVTSIGGECTSGDGNVSWSIKGTASQSGFTACSTGIWTATPAPALSTYGSYLVSAAQSDAAGNIGSSGVQSLTLGDLPPAASFSFLPATPHAGQTVLFNGGASSDPDGSISSYAWSFGDGATGSGVTASHSFAKKGAFTVQLSVADNSGSVGVTAKPLSVSNAAAGEGPVVRVQIPSQRLGRVLRHGLLVEVVSSQEANLHLRLLLPARIAKAIGLGSGKRAVSLATMLNQLPAGEPRWLRILLSPAAPRQFGHVTAITFRLALAVIGPSGKTSVHRRLTLRR